MDFSEALNIKVDDVKRPPLLPVGHYVAMVTKLPENTQSDDGKWEFVDITLRVLSAAADVDADELKEFGGLNDVVRRHRFIFDREDDAKFKRTLYNYKTFLADHLKVPGETMGELINGCLNAQCMIAIGRRTDKNDKETMYEDIKRTAPAE